MRSGELCPSDRSMVVCALWSLRVSVFAVNMFDLFAVPTRRSNVRVHAFTSVVHGSPGQSGGSGK